MQMSRLHYFARQAYNAWLYRGQHLPGFAVLGSGFAYKHPGQERVVLLSEKGGIKFRATKEVNEALQEATADAV